VAWVLRNPAVTGAIVGTRRPDQVRGMVRADDFRLSRRELAEIEEFFTHAVV
jgi:aryl-alcohol dehydrogenase-like predicted oxidoreductase